MFGDLLKGIVDKESLAKDTISDALEKTATELGCSHSELFFTIKPIDEEFSFKIYVYRTVAGTAPKFEREITLKEIFDNT